MNLFDIIKTVGTGIVKSVVPGGGMIIDAVNEFLPSDKKLGKDATGSQMNEAIESLPAEDKAKVLEKEFDVEITKIKEAHNTANVMLEMEAKSTHTTRPKIAYQAFQLVALVTFMFAFSFMWATLTENEDMVETISDGWPFLGMAVLPFVGWIDRYFGKLTTEHKNRLNAVTG